MIKKKGQYTLFAAKMGNQVVSVEPFYDNILRIHKSSYLEKTAKKIILITNAISNTRNEYKLLSQQTSNIGGQSLYHNRDKKFEKDKNNKYLVRTILLDDIVHYLPKEYTKAILKIDIEGFEIYAFENAEVLFRRLDIRLVYMEWGNFPKMKSEFDRIVVMIEFLEKRDFRAFDNEKMLDGKNFTNWPWDIVWKKIN